MNEMKEINLGNEDDKSLIYVNSFLSLKEEVFHSASTQTQRCLCLEIQRNARIKSKVVVN